MIKKKCVQDGFYTFSKNLGLNMSRDECENALASRQLTDGAGPVRGNLGHLAIYVCKQLDDRILSQYQVIRKRKRYKICIFSVPNFGEKPH